MTSGRKGKSFPHRYCLYLIAQISCWYILQPWVSWLWSEQLLHSSYKRPVDKRKHSWTERCIICGLCSCSWKCLRAHTHTHTCMISSISSLVMAPSLSLSYSLNDQRSFSTAEPSISMLMAMTYSLKSTTPSWREAASLASVGLLFPVLKLWYFRSEVFYIFFDHKTGLGVIQILWKYQVKLNQGETHIACIQKRCLQTNDITTHIKLWCHE